MRPWNLVPATLVVLSVGLAVAMLDGGHEWGDDFAAYLMQARGLVDGAASDVVKHSTFTMQHSSRPVGPAVAPWGYPILLVPAYVACGGLNPLCLKLVNIPFFALFVATFYAIAARRLPVLDAVIVTAAFALSPDFLSFQNDLLSDTAFLGLATLTLWLIDNLERAPLPYRESTTRAVLLGLALFASFAVRSIGLVLVLTLALTETAIHRRVLIPFVVFALLAASLRLALPPDTLASAAREGLSLASVLQNIKYYAALPAIFFRSVPYPFGIVFYGMLLAFLIAGSTHGWTTDRHLLVYVALTLGATVAVPWQQGLRYLFPVLPWLLYIAYRGMIASAFALDERHRRTGQWVTRAVWAVVLACLVSASIVSAASNLSRHRAAAAGPFLAESAELFAWVDANTTADAVIVFFKPRAMRLMTGRDAVLIETCAGLRPGQYVVLQKEPPTETAKCAALRQSPHLFENAAFVVYRLQ